MCKKVWEFVHVEELDYKAATSLLDFLFVSILAEDPNRSVQLLNT